MKYAVVVTDVEAVNRQKVPAIKGIRGVTGMGLKDAKDFVEAVYDGARLTIDTDEQWIFTASENNRSTYNDCLRFMAEGGIQLVNDKMVAVDNIVETLKQLSITATEQECYSVGQIVLEALNKIDSARRKR